MGSKLLLIKIVCAALACSSHNKRTEFMYLALPHSIHLAPFGVYSILLPFLPHEIVSSFIYTLLNSLLLDELIQIYAEMHASISQPNSNSQHKLIHKYKRARSRSRLLAHSLALCGCVSRSIITSLSCRSNCKFCKIHQRQHNVLCDTQNGILRNIWYAYAGI